MTRREGYATESRKNIAVDPNSMSLWLLEGSKNSVTGGFLSACEALPAGLEGLPQGMADFGSMAQMSMAKGQARR